MSSRSLNKLVPEMRRKAEAVRTYCNVRGVDLLIYCTLRTLEEQAKLYRQSRKTAVIRGKIQELRSAGFGFLADVLDKVGPQNGPHVTNAAPGESYHNYGMAIDAVPLRGGKALWDYNANRHEWDIYRAAIKANGLYYLDWEYPHAQLMKGGNPLRNADPAGIKRMLESHGLL